MYFDSWSGFLSMEGHGLYVWSAYAVAAVVIGYNLIAPFITKRQVVAQVRRQERLIKRKMVVNDFKVTADSGEDSMLIVWDSLSGTPVRTFLNPHPDGIRCLDLSMDN